MRRRTVKGRITWPYSWGLYWPRSKSATDQMNDEGFILRILSCSRFSGCATVRH